jgi:hypothetical protein
MSDYPDKTRRLTGFYSTDVRSYVHPILHDSYCSQNLKWPSCSTSMICSRMSSRRYQNQGQLDLFPFRTLVSAVIDQGPSVGAQAQSFCSLQEIMVPGRASRFCHCIAVPLYLARGITRRPSWSEDRSTGLSIINEVNRLVAVLPRA